MINMEQFLPVMLLKGLILLPNQEVKIELNNTLSKEIINLATKEYNRSPSRLEIPCSER